MRLSDVYIERYGPLPRFSHSCEENFEVIYGPNESGKTLILEAILRQLAPNIDSVLDGVGRVSDPPSGHVVVETNGTEHRLGGDVSLADLWEFTPRHLRNVFVVRDSDLSLLREHDFYDSVTQQIGDLHTSEIEAIQSRLVEDGRLTSIDGRKLSAAAENDDAAAVRDDAAALATEIRSYVEDAEANEVDDAEREFIAVRSELASRRDELERQRSAKARSTQQTLTERLETYNAAVENVDGSVSSEALAELEDLERTASDASADVRELEAERERLSEKRAGLTETRDTVESELAPLEERRGDVEAVEGALHRFREGRRRTLESTRQRSVAMTLMVLGLGVGGAAAMLGEAVIGGALLALGVLGLGWIGYLLRARRRVAGARLDLRAAARDAGLDVDEVESIAPAIQRFTDELSQLERRLRTVDGQIEVVDEQVSTCESKLADARDARRRARSEIRSRLDDAGVGDVEAYRSRVEENAELRQAKLEARRSLVDSLGEPAAESPSEEARITYWERRAAALVADVPADVSHAEYDPDRLAALESAVDDLEARRDELRERLDEHRRRLREYADRVRDVPATRFQQEPIRLSARTVDGLRAVSVSLDELVARIEREADVAREALSVFDELRAEEERKLRELFGDGSRATEVFARITDGRYRRVEYDASQRELLVYRGDGTARSPRELSHGTREQLYLAARVGLAEQLLGAEPGFFLMDDAFLPVDSDRLRTAFGVLEDLAAEGWQILYFTAKSEVGVDMVDALDLRRRTLTRFP